MTEFAMTIVLFNSVVMALVVSVLSVRALLVGAAPVVIEIEGLRVVTAPRGSRLLHALQDAGLAIPASCGGRGTCGLCRVRVSGALDQPLGTETAWLDSHALAGGVRLACQVVVRGDLKVGLPEGLPHQTTIQTRVRSTRHLTALMKEIILEVPGSVPFDVRAGSYVQVTCPPYRLRLGELDIDEGVRPRWAKMDLDEVEASCAVSTTRAYSLANHSGEGSIVQLVVRLAVPPPGAPPRTPAGVVSSWLCGRRSGDPVTLSGPYGHFVATDTAAEMVFVGGGAGMAPMRSHILEQLLVRRTTRTISFWYGARTAADLFYVEEFDALQRSFPNFSWSAVLSDPSKTDAASRPHGFVHQHLFDAYLSTHGAPASCDYYLCGPPLMVRAVQAMLKGLGVPSSRVFFDDFGA